MMMNPPRPSRTLPPSSSRRHQRGISLVVTMLMLLVITILGVTAARFALLGERSARNDRDREVAFQAAEDALQDAERDLVGPNTSSASRVARFCKSSVENFEYGCGQSGSTRGLCLKQPGDTKPVWMTVDFASNRAVPYGTFTGLTYPTGKGTLPAQAPRYVIESIVDESADVQNAFQEGSVQNRFYRVTAIGFGMRADTQVMLQAIYRTNAKCV
jgi:type IV pilus assembly protein PilX